MKPQSFKLSCNGYTVWGCQRIIFVSNLPVIDFKIWVEKGDSGDPLKIKL